MPWQRVSTITILAVYAPNQAPKNRDFWNELAEKWIGARLPKPDILLGDFNMVEEAIDRLPPHQDQVSSVNSLNNLKEMHALCDGWRKFNGGTLAYSFKQTATQARSRIDRIYVTNETYKSCSNWTIESSGIRTDHYLVSVKVANPQAPYLGKGRWAIPPFALENRKITQMIMERGHKLESEMEVLLNREADRRSKGDVQRLFHKFKTDIAKSIRDFTRTEIPRMEARIKKAKNDLKLILNDPNPDLHLTQMAAHEKEGLIEELEAQVHTKIRDNIAIKHKLEGECLTKYWINTNKEKTPRDTINQIKVPNALGDEPGFTTRSSEMARIAKEYHERLQSEGLTEKLTRESADIALKSLDRTLGNSQKLGLAEFITDDEVLTAIQSLPMGKAPGLDGIPHELWKKLAKRHTDDVKAKRKPFNVVKILCCVFNDIEKNGVDPTTDFSSGWMCPIYKKGDTSDISNYRPITVLNSDYKMMTRVLTTRLSKVAPNLIHGDQAGFMTGRRIEDQTDLTRLMLDRCEAYEENGAIVCLDQEKAYDKIRHDFIWLTLETLNFPRHFIDTVKALYEDGKTCVIVNGVISDYYKVIRGVRQGDPLSCLIFNLAIESLACMLRKSDLSGFEIQGCEEPLITTLFADDTTVYLKEEDSYATLQGILQAWCRVSGAKFNIAKTIIIPLGSPEYRQRLIDARKLSDTGDSIPETINIAKDGEAVRVLGAHVGNNTNQAGIWIPTIEKLNRRLEKWQQGHPTQNGKRLIISMEVGGLTQYLTRVQGMPKVIEQQITRKISKFFWDGVLPTVRFETLEGPLTKGGKEILDLESRNEAIDVMRLKTYLKGPEDRPRWAYVADELIKKSVIHQPHKVHELSIQNIFLQSWKTRSRGEKALPERLQKLLKIAKKYSARAGDQHPTSSQLSEMPAWHHIGIKPGKSQRNNDVWADCQRQNHNVKSVGDLIEFTGATYPDNHVDNSTGCACEKCSELRLEGCTNPHKCTKAGKLTLDMLQPHWDPRKATRSDEAYVRAETEFDKRPAESQTLMTSFRIFRQDDEPPPPTQPEPEPEPNNPQTTHDELEVYISSRVTRRNEETQEATAGAYFGYGDPKNRVVKMTHENQTRQAAELAAITYVIGETARDTTLTLIFETTSTPNLLTHRRWKWERTGWMTHPNGPQIRSLISALQRRKGSTRVEKYQEGKEDEVEAARALLDDPPNGTRQVPTEAEPTQSSGAKLQELTQSTIYRLIQKRKTPAPARRAAKVHLDMIRHAIHGINGSMPNDETIWKAMRNKIYSHRHRAFLWRAVHDSYKLGTYWDTIPNLERRGICPTCLVPESLNHILTECNASGQEAIWRECERVWSLRAPPEWTIPTLGIILGSSLPTFRNEAGQVLTGASRLYTILVSESAQLIWRTRCKWRISNDSDPEKRESAESLIKGWRNTINRRIYLETLQTNTYKYGHKALKSSLVDKTWRSVLKDSEHVRDDWVSSLGGLVGIG